MSYISVNEWKQSAIRDISCTLVMDRTVLVGLQNTRESPVTPETVSLDSFEGNEPRIRFTDTPT